MEVKSKEATGVLGEMIKNINPEDLEKTRINMEAEAYSKKYMSASRRSIGRKSFIEGAKWNANRKKKVAVLSSSHQEVARIPADAIGWVYASSGEDLIRVLTDDGQSYYCDEIEYITEE